MVFITRFSLTFSFLALFATSIFATPVSSLQCANPGSTGASASATSVSANSCTDFSYMFPVPQPAAGVNNWQYGYYSGTTLDPASFQLMASPTPSSQPGWWAIDFSKYWTSLDAFGAHSNAPYTDYHNLPFCTPGANGSCNPINASTGGYDPRSPNGPDSGNYWADRRYIVPAGYAGPVLIDVSAQKDPRTTQAGAQGFVDYVIVYSGGKANVLGCINVPIDGTASANVIPVACGSPLVTADPLNNQPIYRITATVNVKPGDIIDFVTAPVNLTQVPGAAPGTSGYADFSSGSFQLDLITGIPEPSSIALMAGGLALLGVLRKRFAA